MKKPPYLLLSLALSFGVWLLTFSPACAQTAAFTYRGHLTAAGAPANSPHDMEFRLFDTAEVGAGAQQGDTKSHVAVPVLSGVFSVTLDFGAMVFNGSPRYLEIGVRPGGSAAPYTMLAPRQQVASIPYAIQSLNATTAQTAISVANGSAVRSLNGLKDNVILAAGPNVTITPGGNTLTISSTGTGSDLWNLNGADAYFITGNVGIGTVNPFPDNRLHVKGSTLLEPGGTGGGFIGFHTPDTETGMTISGSGTKRADIRFDGSTLKLVATAAAGPPPSANGIAITTAGNVGIGKASPAAGIRLDVKGSTLLEPGGSGGGFIQFHTPDTETGLTISGSGTKRADIRFDGSTLKLVAADAAGPPPAGNGLAISTSGNVGIGTTAPVSKLHAESSLANKAAVYGNATGAGGWGVIGSATGAGGIGVYGQGASGAAVHAEGNATQSRDNGGFVKALAYIDPFLPAAQYVVRSYNSQPGASITVERQNYGQYTIDFGFNVQDRFLSLTPQATWTQEGVMVGMITDVVGSKVHVVFERNSHNIISINQGKFVDTRFHIIVY